jgi:hypothetical protein
MSHLSIERLAALADEQATADESSHLAKCAECTRELEAIRSLVSLAGAEREIMNVPLTRWDTLAKALRDEGLIAESGRRKVEGGGVMGFSSRSLLQMAAALLLVAGGVAAGRVSAGAALLPGGLPGSAGSMTASADSVPVRFTSAADAARWQQIYQDGYQRAIAYLANQDSTAHGVGTPASMRTRLSALDRASRTMREALNDAPYDPVLSDFYLNSFAQREATLRQLTSALPQGARLNSF